MNSFNYAIRQVFLKLGFPLTIEDFIVKVVSENREVFDRLAKK
jgi:hypothetical protein